LYEGTRVTQNVKTRRASTLTARTLAALLLLALGAIPGALGCSSDNKKPDTGSPSGGNPSGGCSGDACAPSGRFTACKQSRECDEAHGFACVDDRCTYECQQHSDCVEVGHCDVRTVDGERKHYCVSDEKPPEPGKLYTACPKGSECADPALCLGAGPGDLDAYCTVDCSTDDDCAAGYSCGIMTRNPCEAACGATAAPTDPRCVPADQIGAGKPFHCGDFGLERSVCRQREFCATCETDADCLAVPNQICAKDKNGDKICTRLCDVSTRSCPWGNAGECGLFDDDVGLATCSHRFGACYGSGKTCEPCRSNDDCPGGACTSSSFTGEHWCINFTTTCECKTVDASGVCDDGGCPKSPGGLVIQCIGTPKSTLFNTCYAASSGSDTLLGSSPQTGCWGLPQ
jgi:hypothetical protein